MNSHSTDAGQRRLVRVVFFGALVCIGAALAASPAIVVATAVVVLYVLLLISIPVDYVLAAAVVVTVGFPWDFMVPLSESRGLVEVIVWTVTAVLIAARVRPRALPRLKSFADIVLVLAVLLASTVATLSSGGARSGLVICAVGAGALVTLLFTPRKHVALEAVGTGLLILGGIHGAIAAVEQLSGGAGSVLGALGWYHPTIRAFSDALGLRASGLMGHPLRLGTLAGLALTYWASRADALKLRVTTHVPLALLSLVGLILSGARGAWLATVVAVAVIGFSYAARLRVRKIGWMIGILGVLAFVASISGVASLALDRLSGTASDPMSLGHRITLLQVAATAWRAVPLTGFGWLGAETFVLGQGAALSTIENEYLRLFLATGPVSVILFVLAAARSVWFSWRSAIHGGLTVFVVSGLFFVLVNLGTYNMMSWSGAAAIVFLFLGAARVDT